MQLNPTFLGIEIGGTKLQLLATDAYGKKEQAVRFTIDAAGGADGIRRQIKDGYNKLPAQEAIAAIGVGFGGPVDWRKGIIRVSHQVSGWAHFPLSEWLQQLTGKPVAIENDANTAALAEAKHGSGMGYERVFYMTIGSGIGGGMVINGSIYHGKEPGEVEVGHIRLNKKGDTLESRCSGWAVDQKVNETIQQQPTSPLAQLSTIHSLSGAVLLKPALEKRDVTAQKIIDEVADDLAFALSHVVHLFHPDIIILGGGLSLLQEHLIRPVSEKLSQYVMPAFLPIPPVQMASLGEQVVPIGAVELAKNLLKPHMQL
jgi:glucokinase